MPLPAVPPPPRVMGEPASPMMSAVCLTFTRLGLAIGLISFVDRTLFELPGGVAGLLGERPSALTVPATGLDAPLSAPRPLCDVDFCWASLSCFRNFARRFWNHTWNNGTGSPVAVRSLALCFSCHGLCVQLCQTSARDPN